MSDPNVTRPQMADIETPTEERPRVRRDANGRLLPGSTLALKHGLRSEAVRSGQLDRASEELAAMRVQLYAEVGASSVVVRSLADNFLALSAVTRHLILRLHDEGPLTGKGNTRALFSSYLRAVDSLDRLAQRLGYDRPKPGQSVPRTGERPVYFDHLTAEELDAVSAILDAARARAENPAPEPTEQTTVHLRIELPEAPP